MQTNEFGYLVRGAKGLFYSDGRYFYFQIGVVTLKKVSLRI